MLAPNKVALVQVARRALDMAEDDYRQLLHDHGGAGSARDLTERGFGAVMDRFSQLGFVSHRRKTALGPRLNMATAAQIDLIRVLWRQLADDRSDPDALERGLRTWLTKYHHVADCRFLTFKAAHKVIGALKAWRDRRASGGNEGGAGPESASTGLHGV